MRGGSGQNFMNSVEGRLGHYHHAGIENAIGVDVCSSGEFGLLKVAAGEIEVLVSTCHHHEHLLAFELEIVENLHESLRAVKNDQGKFADCIAQYRDKYAVAAE